MYKVGDKVVYPHHGAGTVVKREKRDVLGEKREYLTIKILHNDMTVNVPADNAERVGLRKVIDEEAVKKVVKYLTSGGTEMPKNWNRRFKHNRDKMKTGDIYELAEVVRNLALRDGEKGLSTGEKQMYVKAKKILASELMYAKNMSEDDALEWLEETLTDGAKPKHCGRRRRRANGGHAAAAGQEGRARREEGRAAKAKRTQRSTVARPPRRRRRQDRRRRARRPPRSERLGRSRRRRARGAARGGAAEGVRAPRRVCRCSPSRCGGSTSASGSTRSSLVAPPEWEEPAILLAEELGASKVPRACPGGETRTESVRAGVAEVPEDAAVILVHDAARPLLPTTWSPRLLEALGEGFDGAVPGLPVTDTVKRVQRGVVAETLDRDELVAVQTPQAFVASVLRAALAAARAPTARRSSRRPAAGWRSSRATSGC